MNSDTLRRPTAMDLLKRLLSTSDRKQECMTTSSEVKTDIYSVPPTCRRLYPRPRPLK